MALNPPFVVRVEKKPESSFRRDIRARFGCQDRERVAVPPGIGRHSPAKQNQSSLVLLNLHFEDPRSTRSRHWAWSCRARAIAPQPSFEPAYGARPSERPLGVVIEPPRLDALPGICQ